MFMAFYTHGTSSDKLLKTRNNKQGQGDVFCSSRKDGKGSVLKPFITTLRENDLITLRNVMSFSTIEFDTFFDMLTETEQQYIYSLFETYRLDIIDFVLDTKSDTAPEVKHLLGKIWNSS